MTRPRLTPFIAALAIAVGATLLSATSAIAQLPRVGIIDVYGLRKITPAQVKEALGIAVGDSLTALALFWFLNRTETGLCLQATAEDPQVASLMGIDTDRMYALAWGLSAATVGVAGALASTYLAITPLVGANWALPAFVAVAIGGFGSITGAFWGGIIIGLVQTAGGFFTSPSYKLLFVYLLFLVVVLVRPHGLLGKR